MLFAQMEITNSNLPVLGDSVVIAICDNDVEPGSAGVGVIWDMSGLSESETEYFVYREPDATPWGDEFPSAGICGISWEDSYSYYLFNSDGITTVGYAGLVPPSDTFKVIYSNPEFFIPLPYSVGTTHSDDFAGTSQTLGFIIPFTGDIDFEADGEGTLILPTGTYHNVVRYHFNRTQTNTFMGGSTTTTKEQWGWVSTDYRFWLLLMEVTNDGFSDTELIWYDKNPYPASIVSIHAESMQEIHIVSNPITNNTLAFNWNANQTVNYSLTNIAGEIINSENVLLNQGLNSIHFSENISDGLYFLTISTAAGEHYSAKVMFVN